MIKHDAFDGFAHILKGKWFAIVNGIIEELGPVYLREEFF